MVPTAKYSTVPYSLEASSLWVKSLGFHEYHIHVHVHIHIHIHIQGGVDMEKGREVKEGV
jgi:hypothetical protein